MKIRTRLAAAFAITVAVLSMLFGVAVYSLSATYRTHEFYERLRQKAITTVRVLYEANDPQAEGTLNLIEQEDFTALPEDHVTVFGADGKLIYASKKIPEAWIGKEATPLELDNGVRRTDGQREYLYLTHTENNKPVRVIVSATDQYGRSKLRFLAGVLWLGWIGSVAAAVVVGRIFAGRALKPIADVVTQVQAIDTASLASKRVNAGRDKDEINQLAQTFNHMLDRLQDSFQGQRTFVANASHELRTPLTAIKGQVEVALMQPRQQQEYIALLESIGEDVQKITNLSNALLDLAKANADQETIAFRPLRLDEVLMDACAELKRKNKNYHIQIQFSRPINSDEAIESQLAMVGNEPLLHAAFFNLMENACKFSTDHSVQVDIDPLATGQVVVAFADQGPGISAEDLPHIFEPFFRSVNNRQQAGHGVGLALVRRIATLHGANLQVSAMLGQGACFTLTFGKTDR